MYKFTLHQPYSLHLYITSNLFTLVVPSDAVIGIILIYVSDTVEHIHEHIYISVALLYDLKGTQIRARVPVVNALHFCVGKLFYVYITFRFSHCMATIYHNHSVIHSSHGRWKDNQATVNYD